MRIKCKHCGTMSDHDYGGELLATITMGTKEESQILYSNFGLCKKCGRIITNKLTNQRNR